MYLTKFGAFAVLVRRDFDKIKIVSSASVKASDAAAGFVKPPSSLVLEAVTKLGALEKPIMVSLKGDQTFLKIFDLPAVFKGKELETAVRFEARKHTPFAIQELESGFQTLPNKETKKVQIAFFGAKQDILSSWLLYFTERGLKVNSAEPLAVSLARLCSIGRKSSSGYYLIVHEDQMGELNLVVAQNHVAVISRFANLPIAPGEDAAKVEEIYLSELRLCLDYFFRFFKGHKIERIVFCDLASGEKFKKITTQETGAPAEDPHMYRSMNLNTLRDPEFFCAAGAALGNLSFTHTDVINLLPQTLTQSKSSSGVVIEDAQRKNLIRIVATSVGATLAVMAGVYMLLSQPVRDIEKKVKNITAETQALGVNASATIEDLTAQQARYSEALATIGKLESERMLITEKMNEIAQSLPQGMWLTKLKFMESAPKIGKPERIIEIEGNVMPTEQAPALETINAFVSGLSKNKTFMNGLGEIKIVNIQKESFGDADVSHFSITCRKKVNEQAG